MQDASVRVVTHFVVRPERIKEFIRLAGERRGRRRWRRRPTGRRGFSLSRDGA